MRSPLAAMMMAGLSGVFRAMTEGCMADFPAARAKNRELFCTAWVGRA